MLLSVLLTTIQNTVSWAWTQIQAGGLHITWGRRITLRSSYLPSFKNQKSRNGNTKVMRQSWLTCAMVFEEFIAPSQLWLPLKRSIWTKPPSRQYWKQNSWKSFNFVFLTSPPLPIPVPVWFSLPDNLLLVFCSPLRSKIDRCLLAHMIGTSFHRYYSLHSCILANRPDHIGIKSRACSRSSFEET